VGQRPNELTPNASPQHFLGAEMRTWRARRGLSLGRLSKQVLFDPSYMARVERGLQTASAELVGAYDRALDAGGSLVRLHESVGAGTNRKSAAQAHVANLGIHVANGADLLAGRTAGPASSEPGLSIPVRDDDGRTIFVPISRRSLIAALGAGAAMAALSDSVPSDATRRSGLAAFDGNPIELLRATRKVLVDNDNLFGPSQAIPVVRRQIGGIKELRAARRGSDAKQLLRMQGQFAELCGWFYQDLGNFHEAKFWLHEAFEAAQLSGDQELATFVLARRSQLAGDAHDPLEAIDMAEAAQATADPHSKLAAVAATYGAHGHALLRDTDATRRAYDHARQLHTDADPDPDSQWAEWLDVAYIEAQRAYSLAALNDNRGAVDVFRAAIADLPPGFHRDRGVYLAREAVALAKSDEPEQAATVGRQAVAIGSETGSARIGRELARLDEDLNRWSGHPTVIDFKNCLNEAVLTACVPRM
jgi:tetratricopeptide (TPR) repeat protein